MKEGLSRRDLMAGTAALVAAAGAGKTSGAASPTPLPPGKIPVAFLMDEAATMMDFAGPWEVFQDAAMAGSPGYFLFTVAPEMRTYNSSGTMLMDASRHGMVGLKFMPDYTIDDAPQPQVIVIGAQMDFAGPRKVDWLRKAAPGAEIVLSVCTGNFVAAYAGLLDGKKATTHHRFFDRFEKEFPKVELNRDERVVDNGKFVSGGGITAGIDAALHVVRRHYGGDIARRTAEYMEYRESSGAA